MWDGRKVYREKNGIHSHLLSLKLEGILLGLTCLHMERKDV